MMTTLNKIESFCAAALIIMMLIVMAAFLACCTAGCTPVKPDAGVTWGIVDACYTVMEYNPVDADARIVKYLDSKQQQNVISQSDRVTIEQCLKRTKMSNKWGAK